LDIRTNCGGDLVYGGIITCLCCCQGHAPPKRKREKRETTPERSYLGSQLVGQRIKRKRTKRRTDSTRLPPEKKWGNKRGAAPLALQLLGKRVGGERGQLLITNYEIENRTGDGGSGKKPRERGEQMEAPKHGGSGTVNRAGKTLAK